MRRKTLLVVALACWIVSMVAGLCMGISRSDTGWYDAGAYDSGYETAWPNGKFTLTGELR